MPSKKFAILFLAAAGLVAAQTPRAHAIPVLQLYVEGATYDNSTDTWVYQNNGGNSFRLWTIGNVGWKGTIHDVRLAVSYASTTENFTITLTPSSTGGHGGFPDLPPPNDPAFPQLAPGTASDPVPTSNGPWTGGHVVTDGSGPVLGDGSDLPARDIYGAGRYWQEYRLGDFDLTNTPIGDFIDNVPEPTNHYGQINVYEVSIDGPEGAELNIHFDLYNHVMSKNKVWYKFAPFSHDAEGGLTATPEPSAFALMGIGAVGMLAYSRRRRKNARKTE